MCCEERFEGRGSEVWVMCWRWVLCGEEVFAGVGWGGIEPLLAVWGPTILRILKICEFPAFLWPFKNKTRTWKRLFDT